jgi:hypothetical protein
MPRLRPNAAKADSAELEKAEEKIEAGRIHRLTPVIASGAKQSTSVQNRSVDCFVAFGSSQ